jgi:hypothetical protein
MLTPKAEMRKVRRAAKSLVEGRALLERLTEDDAIELMKEAIEEEVPPVSKISQLLLDDLSDKIEFTSMPVRQFVGQAVKAILVGEGFRVMETGVRISGDPVFRTGSTYEPIEPDEDATDDLLARFIATLNNEELDRVRELIA